MHNNSVACIHNLNPSRAYKSLRRKRAFEMGPSTQRKLNEQVEVYKEFLKKHPLDQPISDDDWKHLELIRANIGSLYLEAIGY